jgi:hypothetical protein
MSETVIVVILIVLGAALPLIGLGRVALRARRNLPKTDHLSAVEQLEEGQRTGLYPVEPLARAAHMTDTAPILEWSRVRWDLGLVGGGVLCGAIASVWAVFL